MKTVRRATGSVFPIATAAATNFAMTSNLSESLEVMFGSVVCQLQFERRRPGETSEANSSLSINGQLQLCRI